MGTTHHYTVTCTWSGSTGIGYESYPRAHDVAVPAAGGPASMALSSDPAFRGDPARWNPEQLLVAAASSCQLLSFLAAAAKARIDVVAYTDDATAQMPEDDPPTRITRIVLRPRITVAGAVPEAKLRRLVEVGHRGCYVANSLRTEVVVEPTFSTA